MKRRNIIKGLTLLPLSGTLLPFKSLFAEPAAKSNLLFNGAREFVDTGRISNRAQYLPVDWC